MPPELSLSAEPVDGGSLYSRAPSRLRMTNRATYNIRVVNLAVKRSVTGLGLFTLRPIPAGRRIIEFIGKLINGAEAEVKGGKYLFEINEDCYIDGSARTNLARYLNHSCRPNAVAYVDRKRIWIWSKRAIRAGEEITFDYGEAFVR